MTVPPLCPYRWEQQDCDPFNPLNPENRMDWGLQVDVPGEEAAFPVYSISWMLNREGGSLNRVLPLEILCGT